MEFLHALWEWAYEGNPSYLTKTHVLLMSALVCLCVFTFGYLIGIWHYRRILGKRKKAMRRHKQLLERCGNVESAKTAATVRTDDSSEKVDDFKSAKKQPETKMPFPPSRMIRRVHKAIDTHEFIRSLDQTDTEAWEEPWEKQRSSDME